MVAREATTNGNDAERLVWATRGPISGRVSWVVGAEAGLAGLAPDWGIQAGIVVSNIAIAPRS